MGQRVFSAVTRTDRIAATITSVILLPAIIASKLTRNRPDRTEDTS